MFPASARRGNYFDVLFAEQPWLARLVSGS